MVCSSEFQQFSWSRRKDLKSGQEVSKAPEVSFFFSITRRHSLQNLNHVTLDAFTCFYFCLVMMRLSSFLKDDVGGQSRTSLVERANQQPRLGVFLIRVVNFERPSVQLQVPDRARQTTGRRISDQDPTQMLQYDTLPYPNRIFPLMG